MNPEFIKEEIQKHIGNFVSIKVYGMRNKINTYYGQIKNIYPNIFTIHDGKTEKSFCYADVITGDIKIKYE